MLPSNFDPHDPNESTPTGVNQTDGPDVGFDVFNGDISRGTVTVGEDRLQSIEDRLEKIINKLDDIAERMFGASWSKG